MGRLRRDSSIAVRSDWSGSTDAFGQSPKSGVATLTNSSVCDDQVHPGWRNSSDGGGTFDVTKTVYDVAPAYVNIPKQGANRWAIGHIWPSQLLNAVTTDLYSSRSELQLIADGATAISRVLPTNPAFNLGTAIGELSGEGLPSTIGGKTVQSHFMRDLNYHKERVQYLRNSGHEYLNVEFGWKPLVADLQNFCKAVKKSKQILDSYQKGSDKKIRRRCTLLSESSGRLQTTGVGGVGQMYFTPGLDFINTTAPGSLSTSGSHRLWFSGAFRYHVPVSDDVVGKFAEWESKANHLLGVRPTPEMVWNLSPWTWAVDWFSNTGDVMRNISALGHDGLVLQYGYVMDEFIQTDVFQSTMTYPNTSKKYPCAMTRTKKRLKRRVATPFGFGVDMTKLTPRQDAVVVALGLAQSKR